MTEGLQASLILSMKMYFKSKIFSSFNKVQNETHNDSSEGIEIDMSITVSVLLQLKKIN
jgi:hypothetical protein